MMRVFMVIVSGLSLMVAAGFALGQLAAVEPRVSAAPLGQPAEVSPCTASGTMSAAPAVLLRGETAAVTLRLQAQCPVEPIPLNIVLVLDGTDSMAGAPAEQVKEAAQELLLQLDLPGNVNVQVGVVRVGSMATTLCVLGRDVETLKACIDRYETGGDTGIDVGIREGMRVLLAGRREAREQSFINEVMVLMSDGRNTLGCSPVQDAGRQAKSQGIILATACASDACDSQCQRDVASSARYAFATPDVAALMVLFDRILKDSALPRRLFRSATFVHSLPADMTYVVGSAQPAATFDSVGNSVTWNYSDLPQGGITMSLRLRSGQAGVQPVGRESAAHLVDYRNRPLTYTFEIPSITVLNPPVAPTPTPVPQRWRLFLPAGLARHPLGG
jgi:Mg-chelatase subunit ChlD